MPVMLQRLSFQNRERIRNAAVLFIFAAGLMTFVSFMALVIDVGYLYAMKARLQGVVDSTVLVAATALDPAAAVDAQKPMIVGLSRRILGINGLAVDNYTIDLTPTETKDSWVVEISGKEVMPAFFSAVMGRKGFDVGVGARARPVALAGGKSAAVLVD